jgi:predicted transcriptional regulator
MNDKKVPAAEFDVLACLQRLDQATARDIRECLSEYRPMAHGSVMNLLKRLEAKSLVARRKGSVGKAFVYFPTRTAASVRSGSLRRIVDRVFGGDSLALMASLFETRPPSPDELAKLEQLLKKLRNDRIKKR